MTQEHKYYLIFGGVVISEVNKPAALELEQVVSHNARKMKPSMGLTVVKILNQNPEILAAEGLLDLVTKVQHEAKVQVVAFVVGRNTQVLVKDTPTYDIEVERKIASYGVIGRIQTRPVIKSEQGEINYAILAPLETVHGVEVANTSDKSWALRSLYRIDLSSLVANEVALASKGYYEDLHRDKPSQVPGIKVEAKVKQKERITPPVSATGLLEEGLAILKERGATYDPTGNESERSMQAVVDVFNTFHGTTLTETQGYHFMQILKDVRLFSSGQYHHDSVVDGTNYSALKGEAYAREKES